MQTIVELGTRQSVTSLTSPTKLRSVTASSSLSVRKTASQCRNKSTNLSCIQLKPKSSSFFTSTRTRTVLSRAGLKSTKKVGSTVITSFLSPEQCFLVGTVGVMPFYALMIGHPNSKLTQHVMRSPLPFIPLCVMYIYLFYLSWEPDTLKLMMDPDFYFLPRLGGIATMFSRYLTVASAWLHLITVDLFAAMSVYRDSMANDIPNKVSIVLCLMCCPAGILLHTSLKAIILARRGKAAVPTATA